MVTAVQLRQASETTTTEAPPKPRVGPRRNSGIESVDTTREILDEAKRLFGTLGYQRTSMSAIARGVGLDQSSMYYYFKSKDAILDAILVADFKSCCFQGKLFTADAPCATRLYGLLYRRTFKYCNLPVDVLEVELAHAHGGRFADFFENLAKYRNGLKGLVAEGIADSSFTAADECDDVVSMLITQVMGMQHGYHFESTYGNGIIDCIPASAQPLSPASWAHACAHAGLTLLGVSPEGIVQARSQANEKGWLAR